MVFTEKTFDECLSNLDELNAILLLGQNFGLATILGDKIKQCSRGGIGRRVSFRY